MQIQNISSKIVFGVMGLVLGLVLGSAFDVDRGGSYHKKFKKDRDYNKMHMMGDGKMMIDDDMAMMMHGMTVGLEGKTGDDFDKAFLGGMIVHHEGAVDMAEMVLATSKRPELIKLANDIISAQTGEIKMMQEWQKAWFK